MSLQSEVGVSLEAGDIGWVRFRLRVGGAEFAHEVSDLTDALGDLLRATLQIVCGGVASECVFDLEPGDLTLRLERGHDLNSADGVRITITEAGGGRAQAEVFIVDCASETLGEAVGTLADDIFRRGPDAFHERWDRPFPMRAHAALRQALATPGM